MFLYNRIFNTKKFLHIAYLWATSAPGPSWAFSLVFLLVALTQIIQTSRTSRITKITAPAIPVHTRVTHSGIGISIRKEKNMEEQLRSGPLVPGSNLGRGLHTVQSEGRQIALSILYK